MRYQTIFRPYLLRAIAALAMLGSFSACGVSRMTSTERSAVEQALVHSCTRRAVSTIELKELSGKKVFLDPLFLATSFPRETAPIIDRLYVQSEILSELLKAGALVQESATLADIVVSPVIDFAGVDESDSLLGVPAIPIPLAGPQTALPEIALIKRQGRYGRVKVSLNAVEKASGKVVLQASSKSRETYYSKWTVLIFFGWRATNLENPF